MSEKLEPALSVEEWRDRRIELIDAPDLVVHDDGDGLEFVTFDRPAYQSGGVLLGKYKTDIASDLVRIITLANHCLPDSDPRKITRAHIQALRDAASMSENGDVWMYPDVEGARALRSLADALESYLPPEEV